MLRLTGGRGVDLVVETGGEATFRRSVASVTHGGAVFVIGFRTGTEPRIDVVPLMVKGVTVKPVIDRVFAMEDAREAYVEMAAGGRHFGKIAFEF